MSATSSERDPRLDPRPGDEIARDIKQAAQGLILREVERAHGGFVGYYADNGCVRRWKIVPLSEWQKWAVGAEITKIEGEYVR